MGINQEDMVIANTEVRETILHVAAYAGDVERMKILLDHPNRNKRDINVPNDRGETPLHFASNQGRYLSVFP